MEMNQVRCSNCRAVYERPMGPLARYHCVRCGHRLEEIPPAAARPVKQAVGTGIGATLGFLLGGPPGALVGGFLGLLLGSDQ